MKKKNITVISIFALILIAVAGYYFWLPEYYECKDLSKFLKEKKEMISQEESYLNELNDQLNEISNRQENFSLIESALPSDPSLPALFNFMITTAGENGLSVSSIGTSSSGASSSSSALKQLFIKISASGPYTSLKSFLQDLYKNSRIIEVNNVDFASSDKDPKIFNFNLQLQTNYF
jgi:Tfp pilus assembly protein PilO